MAGVAIPGIAGGREHVLAEQLRGHEVLLHTPNVGALDEPGVTLANPELGPKDYKGFIDSVVEFDPLIVGGAEAPLIAGVADYARSRGLAACGPGEDGAQFEASKAWSRELYAAEGVLVPKWKAVTNYEEGAAFVGKMPEGTQWFVKASGPAGGKGARQGLSNTHALQLLGENLSGEAFGEAGKITLLEECVHGPELSVFVVTDGTGRREIIPVFAQDHKLLRTGDEGPNTGGMGAYAPYPMDLLTQRQLDAIEDSTDRTLAGLRRRGIDYRGVLYEGFMLADEYDGLPVKIEDNIRWGDPEAQVVLPMIRAMGVDLYGDLLEPAAHGRLGDVRWGKASQVMLTMCLAVEGYAEWKKPAAGDTVHGLELEKDLDVKVYQAGTKRLADGSVVTGGGREMYPTAEGATFSEAREKILRAVRLGLGNFRGMQYRTDIGWQMDEAA